MNKGFDDDEQELDFEEFRKFEERQLEMWDALNLSHILQRKERPVWAAAGHNGGVLVSFDPEVFLAALKNVTLPGLSAIAEGRKNAVEVAIFTDSLRMRSQTRFMTFEADIPLTEHVRGLPSDGLAFLISPHRFEPFHTRTYTRYRGEERQVRRNRLNRTDFDKFEYVVDESALALSYGDARLGIKVEQTEPSPRMNQGAQAIASTNVPTRAIVQALRCNAFPVFSARPTRPPEAVFKDNHCVCVSGTRAAAYSSEALDNLKLTIPLTTPLKLATMLARLPDPATMHMGEGVAIVEAGSLRCSFAAQPHALPQLDLEQHLSRCANSNWNVSIGDLQKMRDEMSCVAREGSEVDLVVQSDGGEDALQARIEEVDCNGRSSRVHLVKNRPPAGPDASDFRAARVLFSELKKAIDRIVGQPAFSINDTAVILSDICDGDQRHYFIGNRDTKSA